MRDVQIGSASFEEAQLRSERLRILGILGVLGIFVLVAMVRLFVLRTTLDTAPWTWGMSLAVVLAAYECWILRKVSLTLRSQRRLPAAFWIASTALESAMPGFAMVLLAGDQVSPAYRPLASPAVLLFFLFIVLSTLRLNPWLSRLSGIVAGFSYLGGALHLGWRPPLPGTPAPVTQTHVTLYAIMLIVGGVIAGAVTSQIRVHLRAALREAETKQKLEVVQHDLQVARSIQQSLLPMEPPNLPGFDIAGWNRPADDTGGDYFDWKALPDGKVVISLADVTGHGIGPALLAAVCRAYARSSFGVGDGLQASLERINQALAADLTSNRFVTFVAATCSPAADVEVLSAGHGPLLFYSRATDRFAEIGAQGIPFGILPFFRSDPPAHLRMNVGDLIVLATDGFFEWENEDGEQFGIRRLEDALRCSKDATAAEMIAGLHDSVIKFSNGTKQQDDLTAVIIKRVAAA